MHSRMTPLFALLACILCAGCVELGFQTMRPNETDEYDHLLEPLQREGWYWVRGRITGNVLGDSKEEEIVLVTQQPGTSAQPQPAEKAILLICQRRGTSNIDLLQRIYVFENGTTFAQTALADELHMDRPQAPITHATLRLADMDVDGKEAVLVSLWSDEENGRTIALHSIISETAPKQMGIVFRTLAPQRGLSFQVRDVNKDGGRELLVPQAIFPGSTQPEWLSIYSPTSKGYASANAKYPDAYKDLLLSWYTAYTYQAQNNLNTKDRAVYEYYIGLIHKYKGESKYATHYLQQAIANTKDSRLRSLAEAALHSLQAVPAAPPAKTPELAPAVLP